MRFARVALLVCSGLLALAAQAQTKPLDGVIDIHVHSAPDSVDRSIDSIDLAKLAESRGMRAIVLKNHYEPTASVAYLVHTPILIYYRIDEEGRVVEILHFWHGQRLRPGV